MKIKDENYIVVQYWMSSKLKLSGNDLLIFALIHGFNQDRETKYTGGLNYAAKILSIGRSTVIRVLKKLEDQKLITKYSRTVNRMTLNSYEINWQMVDSKRHGGYQNDTTRYQNDTGGGYQNGTGGGIKMTPNSISNNIDIDIIEDKIVEKQVFDGSSSSQNENLFDPESLKVEEKEKKETGAQKKEKEIIGEIIDYLNEKIDRTLRKDSTAAKQIWHRFKNGATVEEMKKVIDDKVSEWKGTHMEKYLHPSTLFLKSNYEKYIEQMPEKKSGSDEQLIAMFKSPVEEIIKRNGFIQIWDNYQEKSMIEFGRKISESIKGNGGKGTFEEIIEMIGAVIGNLPDFHKQNFSMDYLNKNYSKIINSIKHGGKKGRRETDRIKQALKATRDDAFGGHFKNFHKY